MKHFLLSFRTQLRCQQKVEITDFGMIYDLRNACILAIDSGVPLAAIYLFLLRLYFFIQYLQQSFCYFLV